MALRFEFEIERIPEEGVRLVMEEARNFSASVNGCELAETAPDFFWIDSCFSAYAIHRDRLRHGVNEVVIRTAYREGSNLEALYLLGNFGVRLEGRRRVLTALPDRLAPGSVVRQGLPFYSGKLTYLVPVPDAGGARVMLDIGGFAGSCVTIAGSGRTSMIAWRPYKADVTGMAENGVLRVTDVLTRRNTFGPLHQIPARCDSYGPDSFETSGDHFSDEYVLLEAGLLKPLTLCIGR